MFDSCGRMVDYMRKGIVKKNYWGFKPTETIYIDDSGKLRHDAIGIYDNNKKFKVYVFDKEMLMECVKLA